LKSGAILEATAHRAWPVPTAPWVMAQVWHELLFAHWPIPAEALRSTLPPGLTLDTYDGQAWLGIVPFRMSHVHPRGVPSLPWISAFPELNVRTYVVAQDRPGVYFFSLDAANPVAVAVARRFFYLPYLNASMRCVRTGDTVAYTSRRTHRRAIPAEFIGTYRPTGPVFLSRPGSLEHWLTERYCLYTAHRGTLYRGDIHHAPWPLQPAEAELTRNTMARSHGIELPQVAPLLHYSHLQEVVVWPLHSVPPVM
jgi:uncharacterized protein YqjF (DUF2071 family)